MEMPFQTHSSSELGLIGAHGEGHAPDSTQDRARVAATWCQVMDSRGGGALAT